MMHLLSRYRRVVPASVAGPRARREPARAKHAAHRGSRGRLHQSAHTFAHDLRPQPAVPPGGEPVRRAAVARVVRRRGQEAGAIEPALGRESE